MQVPAGTVTLRISQAEVTTAEGQLSSRQQGAPNRGDRFKRPSAGTENSVQGCTVQYYSNFCIDYYL